MRLFTTYSVRWLLHILFFTVRLRHNGDIFLGAHKVLVEDAVFEQVQARMKSARTSGTSRSSANKIYLLKGLARCIYRGFSVWSQDSGGRYTFYREPKNSHAHANCPANGKSIRCSTIERQLDELVESLVLDPKWKKGILTKVSSLSEHERVLKEKERIGERLRRLGRAFIDGLIDENDYTVQKKLLQDRLDSLVIPEAEAAFDAGEMLENLGPVWQHATLEEKNGLLAGMLEAVYLDLAASKSVVGIVPKPPFYPLFQSLLDESAGRVRVYKPNPEPSQEGDRGVPFRG